MSIQTDTVFWLQVGRPRVFIGCHDPAEDLAGALQTIFPMETEDAYINWNHIPIKLSYKYDISVVIDAIVPLLSAIVENPSGSAIASLNSDTLHADWEVDWTRDRLAIQAKWHSVVGDLDCVRRSCSRMELGRVDFLAEWKELLRVLMHATKKSRILIENDSDRRIVRRIMAKISARGRLYRASSRESWPAPLADDNGERSG